MPKFGEAWCVWAHTIGSSRRGNSFLIINSTEEGTRREARKIAAKAFGQSRADDIEIRLVEMEPQDFMDRARSMIMSGIKFPEHILQYGDLGGLSIKYNNGLGGTDQTSRPLVQIP